MPSDDRNSVGSWLAVAVRLFAKKGLGGQVQKSEALTVDNLKKKKDTHVV